MMVLDAISWIIEYRERYKIEPACAARIDVASLTGLPDNELDKEISQLEDMGAIVEKKAINDKTYYLT